MGEIESILDKYSTLVAPSPRLEYNGYTFVREFGQEYEYAPLPRRFRRGPPKMCYSNSYKRMKSHPDLIYVEGYGLISGALIHHAWCIKSGHNLVLDFTSSSFEGYYGVAFGRQFVLDYWRKHAGESILDNWRDGWPILQKGAELSGVFHSADSCV